MLHFDVGAVGKVGNRAAEFEDAVIGTGAQLHPPDGKLDQLARFGRKDAEAVDFTNAHVAVGEQAGVVGESLCLPRTGTLDAGTDGCRAFAAFEAHQLVVLDARHIDVYVDAVEQRPGKLALVARDHGGRAGAGFDWVAIITTRAGILRHHQQEVRREGQ